jgi:hypothetical protein
MIKNIINNFQNLDKLTKIIIRYGLIFCSSLGMISLIILLTYNLSLTIPILFTIGFILFKLSLTFGIEFIICGFIVDKIAKQII